MFSPSRPYSRACSNGDPGMLDGQRVLAAHVDVTLAGADGTGADHHPLEDLVRVGLEEAAVHVGAGVALVGVADHVLLVAGRLVGLLPLAARGEPCAAAAAKARGLDLGDDGRGFELL